MGIISGSEFLISVLVIVFVMVLLAFMLGVPDGGKMGKVRTVFMLSYGGLSFLYLAFFIGFATSPQHSFARHVADISVAEVAVLFICSILGVIFGTAELFRKPSKEPIECE